MIENFFQGLEREGVSYLLISGQATVLYGAAVFSEDIDLWIDPTTSNATALLAALNSVEATYYKLTPPVEPPYLSQGHGFHFCIPGAPEVYLDIMGCPPRVPVFKEAAAVATPMSTAWGTIPTVSIKHLAALKTTQRLGDYPIISQLVLRYMERTAYPTNDDYQWAIENLHTIDELEECLRAHPAAAAACTIPPLHAFADAITRGDQVDDHTRMTVERWLSERILALRQADRAYWLNIIDDLRTLRRSGKLVPLGTPV